MADVCKQTFDGTHHFAERHWLSRDANGKSADPNVKDNWHMELACVCGERPSLAALAEIRRGLHETQVLRSRRWGIETASQLKLL